MVPRTHPGLTLIKPSLHEFEELLRRKVQNSEDLQREALRMATAGAAQYVVVSMGAEGAVMASSNIALTLPAPRVTVRSSVGAADSFVAAMTLVLARGHRGEEGLAWVIAAGSAAVMRYGTAHPRRSDVTALFRKIRPDFDGVPPILS